ncbi:MAG TPA: DUF2905 domain-containing protein [Dehalococcoidia bacterium]|nr:DUF2905 domain-containing protein [Dehalococcoidia bacterium]
MDSVARLLVFAGLAVTLLGLVLLAASRLGPGRLPGDIVIERGNFSFALLLGTSLLLSVVLTVVLNIVLRIWR